MQAARVMMLLRPASWGALRRKAWIERPPSGYTTTCLAIALADKLAHRLECAASHGVARGPESTQTNLPTRVRSPTVRCHRARCSQGRARFGWPLNRVSLDSLCARWPQHPHLPGQGGRKPAGMIEQEMDRSRGDHARLGPHISAKVCEERKEDEQRSSGAGAW